MTFMFQVGVPGAVLLCWCFRLAYQELYYYVGVLGWRTRSCIIMSVF